MSKESDLRLVLSAVETSGLESLKSAMTSGRVIVGRFIDGRGGGCLIHFASGRTVHDRESRLAWEQSNPLVDCECSAAIKRVIVGWDANDPSRILKGDGYDTTYPKASYVISASDVLAAVDSVLAERSAANLAEDAAVTTAVRNSEAKVG